MTKWQYVTLNERGTSEIRIQLQEFGDAGWELCGVVSTTEPNGDLSDNWPAVVRYIFKRPIPVAKIKGPR